MMSTGNEMATITQNYRVEMPEVTTKPVVTDTRKEIGDVASGNKERSDAVALTILNKTRRRVAYMERSMINEQSSGMDRNTLLQTMTQLSVKANDTSVSAENRRSLRSEINNIISDIGLMGSTKGEPTESTDAAVMVETARENILGEAKTAVMAQANQNNQDVLGLLV